MKAVLLCDEESNDGNYTGWSAWGGTWSAANNYLRMTPGSAATIAKANTDNDNEVRFSYVCNDTSNAGYALTVSPRYASSGDRIYLEIKPGSINLSQRVSGVWSSLDTSATSSTQGTEYTIRVVCDGQDVTVYRTAPGALEEEILSTSSCTVASTNNVSFTPSLNADYSIDNIRILADGLSNATTFAVNNANELTSMTDYNGSTTFGFDAWGRMTSKARGSYAAAYAYRYGQMLRSHTSDFPGEGNVTYEYGGDGKRRERIVGSTLVREKWGIVGPIVQVEDDGGDLLQTRIANLAEISGASPQTGEFSYFMHDRLWSILSVRASSKSEISDYAFGPFGRLTSQLIFQSPTIYSSLVQDSTTGMYYSAFRYFDPELARWSSRDPLGPFDGPNLYTYAANNPIRYSDPLGLTVYLCHRRIWGGLANHAYLWWPAGGGGEDRYCGTQGGHSGPITLPQGTGAPGVTLPAGGYGYSPDSSQADRNASKDSLNCRPIKGSDGIEGQIMDYCMEHANDGNYMLGWNDCFSHADNIIDGLGLPNPGTSRGRVNIDDDFMNALNSFRDAIFSGLSAIANPRIY